MNKYKELYKDEIFLTLTLEGLVKELIAEVFHEEKEIALEIFEDAMDGEWMYADSISTIQKIIKEKKRESEERLRRINDLKTVHQNES